MSFMRICLCMAFAVMPAFAQTPTEKFYTAVNELRAKFSTDTSNIINSTNPQQTPLNNNWLSSTPLMPSTPITTNTETPEPPIVTEILEIVENEDIDTNIDIQIEVDPMQEIKPFEVPITSDGDDTNIGNSETGSDQATAIEPTEEPEQPEQSPPVNSPGTSLEYDFAQCRNIEKNVQGGRNSPEYKTMCKKYEDARINGSLPDEYKDWDDAKCRAAVEDAKKGKGWNIPVHQSCSQDIVNQRQAAIADYKKNHTQAEINLAISGKEPSMTAAQCEESLKGANAAADEARSTCTAYLNKTDISWAEKEKNYADYCKSPNFNKHFATKYSDWSAGCMLQFPASERNNGTNKKSYTRFIQDVMNNYSEEGIRRNAEVKEKAKNERTPAQNNQTAAPPPATTSSTASDTTVTQRTRSIPSNEAMAIQDASGAQQTILIAKALEKYCSTSEGSLANSYHTVNCTKGLRESPLDIVIAEPSAPPPSSSTTVTPPPSSENQWGTRCSAIEPGNSNSRFRNPDGQIFNNLEDCSANRNPVSTGNSNPSTNNSNNSGNTVASSSTTGTNTRPTQTHPHTECQGELSGTKEKLCDFIKNKTEFNNSKFECSSVRCRAETDKNYAECRSYGGCDMGRFLTQEEAGLNLPCPERFVHSCKANGGRILDNLTCRTSTDYNMANTILGRIRTNMKDCANHLSRTEFEDSNRTNYVTRFNNTTSQ